MAFSGEMGGHQLPVRQAATRVCIIGPGVPGNAAHQQLVPIVDEKHIGGLKKTERNHIINIPRMKPCHETLKVTGKGTLYN